MLKWAEPWPFFLPKFALVFYGTWRDLGRLLGPGCSSSLERLLHKTKSKKRKSKKGDFTSSVEVEGGRGIWGRNRVLNVVLIPVSPQNTTRSDHRGDVGVTLAGLSVT